MFLAQQRSNDPQLRHKARLLDEEEVHRPLRCRPLLSLVNSHQSRTVSLNIRLVPVPVEATATEQVAQVAATAVQRTITVSPKLRVLP